ncbi:MAG TPA: hypothetical protein VFB32_14810 [Rudaea sp.]|nr:hypothetical protein [Rudaea sp.]
MSSRYIVYIAMFAACSSSVVAHAEVKQSAPDHFVLEYTFTTKATPAKAYADAVDVAHWWSADHTYSGNANNLSMAARAGGCFCEKLPGGGVQHMTVMLAMPGKLLRLAGGLGPLQAGALSATLTFTFKPVESGTAVNVSYVAAGYLEPGLDKVAGGVDHVLGEQVERLRQLTEGLAPAAGKKKS